MSRPLITQVADSTPYNNDAGSFPEGTDTVQDAIAATILVAAPLRTTIPLVQNGTLSNGDWLGYSNLLPGDGTPIVCPMTGSWEGFTWSNKRSTASFQLDFRLGSTTATPFFSWSTVNTLTDVIAFPSPPSVTAGDVLFIQYIDQGTNAVDAGIVLLFKS
jgi:hypothetical protein